MEQEEEEEEARKNEHVTCDYYFKWNTKKKFQQSFLHFDLSVKRKNTLFKGKQWRRDTTQCRADEISHAHHERRHQFCVV